MNPNDYYFFGSPDRGTGGLLGGKYFFPAGLLYKEQTHGNQRSL